MLLLASPGYTANTYQAELMKPGRRDYARATLEKGKALLIRLPYSQYHATSNMAPVDSRAVSRQRERGDGIEPTARIMSRKASSLSPVYPVD